MIILRFRTVLLPKMQRAHPIFETGAEQVRLTDIAPGFGNPRMYPSTFCVHPLIFILDAFIIHDPVSYKLCPYVIHVPIKVMVNVIEENMNQVVTELQTTLEASTKDIQGASEQFCGNTQKFAADFQDKLDDASKNAGKEMKVLTDKVKEAVDKEVDKFNL